MWSLVVSDLAIEIQYCSNYKSQYINLPVCCDHILPVEYLLDGCVNALPGDPLIFNGLRIFYLFSTIYFLKQVVINSSIFQI